MIPACLQQRHWPDHEARPVLGRFQGKASVKLRCLSAGRPSSRCAQLVTSVILEVHLEVRSAASPRRAYASTSDPLQRGTLGPNGKLLGVSEPRSAMPRAPLAPAWRAHGAALWSGSGSEPELPF